MAWSFGGAAHQAERLAGDYVATIRAEGIEGIAQRISNLRSQILGLNEDAARVLVLRDQAMASRGPIGSRWGNVFSYARGGIGVTPAHIAEPKTIYKYAEPETGGEAFIPRNGDAARSMGILETAAGWYGARVVSENAWPGGTTHQAAPVVIYQSATPAGAGPGGAAPPPPPTLITIDMSGLPSSLKQFVRETVRVEGGGDVQVAFGQ